MKKTRKLLSIVLSVLVVFASLPVVYTAAADAVTYAAGETGTIDNPTHPVSADGVFSYDDLYKLNIDVENTKYTFYQTMNDEYFTYTQILGLQQKNDVPLSGRTFKFVGVEHYTGGTNATTTNADGSAQGTDLMEVPAITTNATAEFLNKYYVPTHTWAAINNNASGLGSAPSNVQLQGSVADLSGCKNYSWSDTYVIKGLPASEKGEVNTGYYESYKWNWSTSDTSAAFELRLKTSIRILDAREFVKELAEAEAVLANPDKYTQAYLSSVKATLNTIPEDLKDLSVVYSQSDIDKYTKMLKDVNLNSADYTEFNRTYENLNSITNALDAFTDDSFNAFRARIEEINNNLPKNLDYTKQDTVDQATQALKDAYNILVHKGTQNTDSSSSSDVEDVTFVVGNDFKFIQIEDNQVFSFVQPWTIYRGSKSSNRKFYSALDTSDSATNTFISKLSTVATNQTISTGAVKNGLSNAAIFTSWEEVTSTGELKDSSNVIDRTTGRINASYDGFQEGQTYYLENSPVFTGLSSTETGEHIYTYKQNIYVSYYAWFSNTYGTSSVTTTLTITDARALVKAVAQANATIANPGSYSDNYISALQAAVDAVPVNLIRGVQYYTQAEVDTYLNAINSVQEGCADYSEFNEAYEELINMKNNSTYTDESYSAFMEEIQNINKNLPKNLPASEQATVDAATEALHKATHNLVYYKLNTDNVFTEEDIPEDLGFSPLGFSVSSTRYEFMQVSDGQQFAIRTDFSARNNDSSYTIRLLSFGFSTVNAGNVTDICAGRTTPDKGCHNAANVPELNFIDLATYASTSGTITGITSYTADDAGDTGEFNSWVNTDGVNLSSGGVFIDGAELELYDSTGYATYVYTATSDEAQENININYAFRLGWSYEQFWGETIRRHAHIPVSLTITDARALHNLYNEVEDILNGETDKSYTLSSLVTLYNAFNNVPSDMASGEAYYTQSEVNAKYDELKAAYDTLVEGADYSEFFEAYVKAQEIINTNNKDSAGNSLYDDAAYETFNQQFTDIITSLDMNLPASEQTTVNDATTALNNALAALEATKRADYSEFNDALAEIEKILKEEQENPGTYTQSSLEAIQNAYNDAVALDKNLPASEQATVDAVTEALKAAAESKKYKADYSEFDDAYSQVKDIVDNPNKYTDATVEAAEKALEEANKLNKDLPDTAENRTTIENATNALKDVLNNAEKSADYSAFEEAYKKVQEIAENKDGKYTDATVEAAQNALTEADKLDKNLPPESQSTINEATNALQSVIDGAKEKANYDGLDEALEGAKEVVNAPEGTYTEESVKKAQDAIDAAEALDKELEKNDENQQKINDVIQDLIDAKEDAKEKANYDGLDEALEGAKEIVNAPEGTYTEESVKNAQDAIDAAEALDKELEKNDENQQKINDVIQDLIDAKEDAKEKANYDGLDEALEGAKEIVNAPEGTYTEESVKNAQDAIDAAEALDKELEKNDENQQKINDVIQDLIDAKEDAKEKANYDGLDEALEGAKEIVNAPEGTYTEESVKKAQDAIDAAEALDKDLEKNDENQQKINDVIQDLIDAKEDAKEKANYDGLDEALEGAKEIVNAPEGTYTEESVKNAQDAIDAAEALDKDLEKNDENQQKINDVIQDLIDAKEDAQEKANYDAYNNAKAEADAIINSGNVDENGNPIYDEAVFEAYKEEVNKIDSELIKDLPSSEQTAVDNAVTELESLKATLESKKYYTVTFKDVDGNVLGTSSYVNGDVFGNLTAPALPEDTDTIAYVGWVYADGTLAKADDVVSGDMDVTVASEAKKLIAKDESGVTIDEITSFVSGIEAGTTVEEVLSKFDNDELVIEIKTYEGVDLASEELVGTGSTITLKSKYTGVVYETRMFIIMGDVDGDGDIDDTDFEISKSVGFESYTYPDEHNYFFIANDIDENGIINVLDAFYIGRMKTV